MMVTVLIDGCRVDGGGNIDDGGSTDEGGSAGLLFLESKRQRARTVPFIPDESYALD